MLENIQMKYGDPGFIIRDSKTLDNILNASRVKKRSIEGIIKEWRETTEEELINTTGTEFIFTKISKDVESTFVNRDPLKRMYKKSTVASLFNSGIKHGFCLCTSFTGDIVSNGSELLDCPEIINKTYVLEKDKFEYE
jgi:regulator of replication initiation timing